MAADPNYPAGIYKTQGGATLEVPAGSTINIDGTLAVGGNNVLNGVAFNRIPKVVSVALVAGTDTGGGIVSWANPEATSILIDRIIIDVNTIATGANSISAGTTAVSGTTVSANLIDTLDVHSATGTFDNITDKGANGKSRQKLASGKWVTISTASGASAGLVGFAWIYYVPV